MTLNPLTIDNAPEQARPLLEKAKQKYGFVPNLLGVMAHAPATLEAYMTLSGLFDKTSLSPTERQVVLLAISAENECTYCVAAHTAIGMKTLSNYTNHAAETPLDDAFSDAAWEA